MYQGENREEKSERMNNVGFYFIFMDAHRKIFRNDANPISLSGFRMNSPDLPSIRHAAANPSPP